MSAAEAANAANKAAASTGHKLRPTDVVAEPPAAAAASTSTKAAAPAGGKKSKRERRAAREESGLRGALKAVSALSVLAGVGMLGVAAARMLKR